MNTKAKNAGRWHLIGHDTFAGEEYPLSEHDNEESCFEAARERIRHLEETQPTKSSGGQEEDGIQDRVYVVAPNGTRRRVRSANERKGDAIPPKPHKKPRPYVTVSQGLHGYYAVLVIWRRVEGIYEPFMTGVDLYRTELDAVPEAVAWARDERVVFKLKGFDEEGNQLS